MTAQDEVDLAIAVELADIIDIYRLAALGANRVGVVLEIETVAGFEHLPEVLLTAMR